MKSLFQTKHSWSLNWLTFGLLLGGVFAATTIVIPLVEKGSGVSARPDCLQNAIVDFETSMSGNLSGITITGLAADCAGKWVRLSVFASSDRSGTAAEQIVWQMPTASSPQVSSYTARANGSTTGVSGSVIWPSTETGAAGLASSLISSSAANSFRLEISSSTLADGP